MRYILFIFLAAAIAANADPVQHSQCFPQNAPSDWPVCVIYMHGLFPPNSSGSASYLQLEKTNRQKLATFANGLRSKRCRVAVPTSPKISHGSYGTNHQWAGTSLGQVESMSRSACGGAKLAKGRVLIGFSNGGYLAKTFSHNCAALSQYSEVYAIGAPNSSYGRCRNFRASEPHVFPGAGELEAKFASLVPSQSGSEIASQPEQHSSLQSSPDQTIGFVSSAGSAGSR